MSRRSTARPEVSEVWDRPPGRRCAGLICRYLTALLTLTTYACAGNESAADAGAAQADPAPIVEQEVEPEADPIPFVEHPLAEGQTLWDVARAYGVSVDEIMEANRLRARDVRRLRPGRTLRIEGVSELIEVQAQAEPEVLPEAVGGAYHRLAEGQTLWDVARLYEVQLHDLMERNELDDEGVRSLRPGRAVLVPGATERQVERLSSRPTEPRSSGRQRGFSHRVAQGETIWDLAGTFGVTVGELMAANRLDRQSVTELREGSRLYIPGVSRDQGGRVRRHLSRNQRRAQALARRLGLGTRTAARALLRGRVEDRWLRAASRGQRRGRTPGHLRWPVSRGWFVRGFGSGEGHYHLAVDIMGRIGWNVRAAAAGIVAYSGDEIQGYGNVVLMIHPGGWVTMYAHNSANSVVAGQRIPRGGILAEVGSTGISRGPHVHFEFMYDGKNCDPASLFRPGIRHRDGHHTTLTPQEWRRGSDRPEQIRCHRRRRHPRSRWVVREGFEAETQDP